MSPARVNAISVLTQFNLPCLHNNNNNSKRNNNCNNNNINVYITMHKQTRTLTHTLCHTHSHTYAKNSMMSRSRRPTATSNGPLSCSSMRRVLMPLSACWLTKLLQQLRQQQQHQQPKHQQHSDSSLRAYAYTERNDEKGSESEWCYAVVYGVGVLVICLCN
ncbi:probable serine/threonine-protein kinase mps1 [Drosophila nasuta]|uniref:probable serine/threonine-protein kinase mps1 n=1 Tax=Drosophila nasuta TaxID=42062 RepID=UPI00295EA952|nr:probable serine/threonine-protein kinase mps1 [Drosophila nasuta]